NPVAKQAAQRADADAVVAMLKSRNISTAPAPFEYPEGYHIQPSKKQKTTDPSTMYPDTNDQYTAALEDDKAAALLSYAVEDDGAAE
ncbi:hypothetical protein DYB25_008586, partial [Aphanomyces astaci]